MSDAILSAEELDGFAKRGYVRIREALSEAFVQRVRTVVWRELESRYGMVEGDPATWRPEWCGINKDKIDGSARPSITPRLTGAINQILGEGTWRPIKTLGGLLMTMPEGGDIPWEVVANGWHFDNDPRDYVGKLDELMLFTFYSSVQPEGGGTLVLSGSHRLVETFVQSPKATGHAAREFLTHFGAFHPYLAQLTKQRLRNRTAKQLLEEPVEVEGAELQVTELTGEPGDAILCHPALFHAVSRNASDVPRIMRRTNIRRTK